MRELTIGVIAFSSDYAVSIPSFATIHIIYKKEKSARPGPKKLKLTLRRGGTVTLVYKRASRRNYCLNVLSLYPLSP